MNRNLIFMLVLLMTASAALANPNPPAVNADTQTDTRPEMSRPSPPDRAQLQTDSPEPLSPDEIAQLQPASDSLMAGSQMQQMPVGATVDGTVVLSVLVALLIFAVLITIL